MFRFLIGFVLGVVAILLGMYCYVRLGFVDPRADAEVGAIEHKVAMPALDASVDRRAPDAKNPIEPSEENLIAGMKIYQTACAGCHGDIAQPHSAFGDAFYPRAPQFVEDAPDMPESQNFYIIQHGIKLSGMPAWKTSFKEQELWQVTTFLSHMDKLQPAVAAAWKAAAAAPSAGGASEGDSQSQSQREKDKPRHEH
jgi:mono/diheme cytochrome c family protein